MHNLRPAGRPGVSVDPNQGKRSNTGNLFVIPGVRLEGKQTLASDLYSDVKCFVSESKLFILQMSKGSLVHFERMVHEQLPPPISSD